MAVEGSSADGEAAAALGTLEPPLADHLALKREVLLQDVPLDGALNRLRLELHLRVSPQEGTRFAVRMTRDVGLGGLGGCEHG